MRSPLLAVALLASACVGEISDTDDGNRSGGGSGSGSGSGSQEETPVPRVTGSFDKATLTTELAKTEALTLSVVSENGFSGNVTMSAVLTDSTGAALNDVELTAPMGGLTLAGGGTQTAMFELKIPMDALGAKFEGALKVDLMTSAGTTVVSLPVTIDAVYTVDYIAGTGYTPNLHTNAGNMPELAVKKGAILRFTNSDVLEHVIYAAGALSNYHENTVSGGKPGRTYDIPTGAVPPGTATLGCFSHGSETRSIYTIK